MIPEAIVERKYVVEVDGSGKQIKQRDVNRSPNVTEVLDNFINTHNESLAENSPQRLVWFSDSLTNRQRQKRAKNIIRSKLNKHCMQEWLDGSITFNACQIEHGGELEVCIEEINGVPLMAVYAQAERSWAVRRMMEDIFANRRRTYLKKMKSAQSTIAKGYQKIQTVHDVTLTELEHADSKTGDVMSEAAAASAAARAFTLAQETSDKATYQLEEEHSFSQKQESSDNLSDIEEQIAVLKSKKNRLRREKKDKKRYLENAIERNEGVQTHKSSKRARKSGKKEKVGKKKKNT